MKEVLNVRHHHNKRIGIPRIVQHTMHKQGVVTYMSPGSLCDGDQGFCRSAKNVLALDRSIFNGSNVKLQPCVQIFGVRSFNNLICSFLLKKSFIQSWSQSQTLLHGTYKWLPLAIQWTKGITRTRELTDCLEMHRISDWLMRTKWMPLCTEKQERASKYINPLMSPAAMHTLRTLCLFETGVHVYDKTVSNLYCICLDTQLRWLAAWHAGKSDDLSSVWPGFVAGERLSTLVERLPDLSKFPAKIPLSLR